MKKRTFVKAYTDPFSPTFGNQGKSAQAAGYAASSANALMKDQQVRNMMRTALERHGIDDDSLAICLKEGLRAEEVKLAAFEGKFTDERRVPDFRARARFQEIAHELRGDYPNESEAGDYGQIIIEIPYGPMTPGHQASCGCATCVKTYMEKFDREQVPTEPFTP